MPIRFGSEPGSLGGVDKVYVGSDLVWPVSTLWTPEQFGADLLVWLDLQDVATLTVNGSSRMDGIANKGSLGGSLLAQATNRPIYGATYRNGLPAIFNDNTWDNGLGASMGPSLPAGDAASTMVGVGWMTVNDGAASALMNWGDLNSVLSYRWIVGYFGDLYGDYGGSGPQGGNPWVNVDRVASYEHEPGTNYATESGADFTPVAEDVLTTTTAQQLQILRAPNVGMQEAMILSRKLTSDERLKLHGYLHHKWGLTANLPGAHPYKSAAPTV